MNEFFSYISSEDALEDVLEILQGIDVVKAVAVAERQAAIKNKVDCIFDLLTIYRHESPLMIHAGLHL